MVKNLCLLCGVSILEGEFCSSKHEEKYRATEPSKKLTVTADERARRRKLLDTLFETHSAIEYAYAVCELRKYHLTVVGRGNRVIDLRRREDRHEAA